MRSSYLYALVASILSSAVPALPADFPTLEEFQDTIDKYGTNAWRQVGCDAGVLPDALKDPEGQWKDSKADDAWKDAVAKWKKEKPENAKFPTWLANYFNAPPGFACEKLATGECQVLQVPRVRIQFLQLLTRKVFSRLRQLTGEKTSQQSRRVRSVF